jgi:hypothetical protein
MKKETKREKKASLASETSRLVLRLPSSIRDSLELSTRVTGRTQLDWAPVREVLDEWAESGDPLEPEVDLTTQVCFHVRLGTGEALREEAARLSEETGRQWTVSQVVATLWNEHG